MLDTPQADPTEVERLRAEIDEWKKRCQYNADTAHDIGRERDTLRAQLAEAQALLRDVLSDMEEIFPTGKTANKVRSYLSASTAEDLP